MKSQHRNSLASFISNQRGSALIEFVFLAPLLFALFFGVIELSRYIIILQKLERLTYSMSTMVITYNPALNPSLDPVAEINADNLNNFVFTQVSRVMNPYNDPDDTRSIISSVTKGPNVAPPNINWQIAGGGNLNNADTVSIVNGLKPSEIDATVRGTVASFNATINAQLATMELDENMIVIENFYVYRPVVSEFLVSLGLPALAETTLVSRVYTMPRYGKLRDLPPDFPVPAT